MFSVWFFVCLFGIVCPLHDVCLVEGFLLSLSSATLQRDCQTQGVSAGLPTE